MSSPGNTGLAISWPKERNSQCGQSRTDQSSHPRYQSGWDPADTVYGVYGPYSQTGLIWNRPPKRKITPLTIMKSPVALAAYCGQIRLPRMLVSVLPTPGKSVCF